MNSFSHVVTCQNDTRKAKPMHQPMMFSRGVWKYFDVHSTPYNIHIIEQIAGRVTQSLRFTTCWWASSRTIIAKHTSVTMAWSERSMCPPNHRSILRLDQYSSANTAKKA